MSTKVYILHMSGQGDVEIRIVDQATWDWIETGGPMPATTKAEFILQFTPDAAELAEADTIGDDSGSAENDRALAAPQQRFNGEIFTGDTIKTLNAFLKKHDLEIEDEWEGYIY